jgi:K+-sensing histidine kinase KdpD
MSPEELGELLGLLSHDLKNPLAAVLTNVGFVGSSLGDEASDDVREAIADARQACASLQRMIGNLEALARDMGSRPPPSLELPPLDLALLVDEAVARHREPAAARRVRITLDAGTSLHARGEREAVLRALDNLLANAVQYAPARSEVQVRQRLEGERALVEVVDGGPRVPRAERRAVLTAEGQARAKGRPEARYGRGLTLYVASLSVAPLDGRIEVDSDGDRSVLRLSLAAHRNDDLAP